MNISRLIIAALIFIAGSHIEAARKRGKKARPDFSSESRIRTRYNYLIKQKQKYQLTQREYAELNMLEAKMKAIQPKVPPQMRNFGPSPVDEEKE